MRKPVRRYFHEGDAECHDEILEWGEAFCVEVDCPALYSAAEVRKLIRFLEKAEKWMQTKEQRIKK